VGHIGSLSCWGCDGLSVGAVGSVIAWFKSLGIWAILGTMLAAAMLALRAQQKGKIEAKNEYDEDRIKNLNTETEADIIEAAKRQEAIARRNKKAEAIDKKSEAAAARVGQDESASDVFSRFNNGRVRRASPIAPIPASRKKKRSGSRSN